MKIICWNVNGLRSPSMSVIDNKELNKDSNIYKLLTQEDPDILCLSETKCQKKNEETFNNIFPFKYKVWNSSTKKLGYSGVCVFSKFPFKDLGNIPGLEDDKFGRSLFLEFEKFILCHVYVPNSGSNKDDYRKDYWDHHIYNFLNTQREKPIIYCGDLNVVCSENDIYNIQSLKRAHSPGTKKYERDNFKKLLSLGYCDSHRCIFPNDKLWTWWNPRNKSRDKDNGWRLDYFLIPEKNKQMIKDGKILKDILGSDHCPISLEIV